MTRKQFAHIATNFVDFAGKEVTFKQYVPWYNLTHSKKFRTVTGKLAGVGIHDSNFPASGESLIIAFPVTEKRFPVHYKFIAYPAEK